MVYGYGHGVLSPQTLVKQKMIHTSRLHQASSVFILIPQWFQSASDILNQFVVYFIRKVLSCSQLYDKPPCRIE
jgi:hypothetical protein